MTPLKTTINNDVLYRLSVTNSSITERPFLCVDYQILNTGDFSLKVRVRANAFRFLLVRNILEYPRWKCDYRNEVTPRNKHICRILTFLLIRRVSSSPCRIFYPYTNAIDRYKSPI